MVIRAKAELSYQFMDQIKIIECNPDWANMFEREAKSIRKVLGNLIADIQHIGSTAVPGLAAKPIIDIMVGVHCLEDGQSTIKPLEDLGI